MIPKKIHYVWVGDQDKIHEVEKEWMEEVKAMHPDWEVKIWSDKDVPVNTYLTKCLAENLHNYAADYIRAYVLYHQGGIYLDTDVKLLKPIPDKWRSYNAIAPKETPWMISNFLLGSIKLGRMAKHLLDLYENFEDNGEPLDEDWWVAPKVLDIVVPKSFGKWGVCHPDNGTYVGSESCLILEEKIICPYYPWNADRINHHVNTAESVGIHYWNSYKKSQGLDLLSFETKYFD